MYNDLYIKSSLPFACRKSDYMGWVFSDETAKTEVPCRKRPLNPAQRTWVRSIGINSAAFHRQLRSLQYQVSSGAINNGQKNPINI